jgi:uncharacterized protein (TIGR03435 family)
MLSVAMLAVISLQHGHCEDLTKAPAFEVASITPCKPGTPEPAMEHTGMVQFTFSGGRFEAKATTLKFLLEWAYGIQPSQHAGGPSWIDTDRYDIVAKAEGSASDDQMKLMMRSLLADRFKLKLHHETKDLLAYVISVGKTSPKLFPPKEGESRSLRFAPQMGPDQKIASYRLFATRFSLAQLSDTFARQLGRVIVDETGLKGEYDFNLEIAADEGGRGPMDPAVLFNALREQLGLTLKSEKKAVDVLAIDGAEKVVAGN